MDRLVAFVLIGMLSSNGFAAVDNFQELISTASSQQAEAANGLHLKTPPVPKARPSQTLEDKEFTIKLVRIPWKKRTMVAKEMKEK